MHSILVGYTLSLKKKNETALMNEPHKHTNYYDLK